MNITGSAKLAGVLGWPVAQSLSPRMHSYWIEEYGIDGAYVPLPVRQQDFAIVVNGLRLAGFQGVNVTVPHKEAAFALADRSDPTARTVGAANLLLFGTEGIEARNTDTYGLHASLCESLGADILKGQTVALWGAGGFARAAVCVLSEMGAAEIRILNRDKARVGNLITALASGTKAKLVGLGFEDWQQAGRDITLLVNATSAGMKFPSIDLQLDTLPKAAAVLDAVYNPLETGLLARAKAGGLRTIDGLGILMHQAVPSFSAFYGVEPKVSAALRSVLESKLRHGR
jgi:shikimate dehydrogenase